ncbi:IclR family transcriptional regulator [Streptosporangium sp. NBC_01755]|uniref:IclR family transcriptional regulator n=1 Tax=unclassified Streptosporangium TaxID=2632669 RepID=UPI002DDAA9DA|nr:MULTISPECIES: IclR family transcriptional regulator [unclassified Streptosporangium]WSA24902.1 IclR family transcriptional regulator [Streptosporangium sp. NBC_01810]WSD03914.1 IclR family transcriptional regulator [Streptosporangium sp. NBC_01755]
MADQAHSGDADVADEVPAIQTVRRAALILSGFTSEHPWLSLNEITARLGVSKPTAHRYARALRAANLLRYDPRSALYSLGPQLLGLEAAARAGLPIAAAAGPHLELLMREINQTVVLSVWNGECPVVVGCVDNTVGDVRLSVRTGSQLDVVRSAQGRIFCAYLPAGEVPGLARRLRASAELRELLKEVRRTGIAVNSPVDHGVRVLAAPIFEGDQVVASMAVLGTVASLAGDLEPQAAAALLRVARDLSRELGGTAPV